MNVSYGLAYYWRKKFLNPHFRESSWCGDRTSKYPLLKNHLRSWIWNFLKKNPASSLNEIKNFLNELGVQYSRSTISRLLKMWRWSFKVPSSVQKEKFTIRNMTYYIKFCRWLKLADLTNVKFIDEVHFDPRGK